MGYHSKHYNHHQCHHIILGHKVKRPVKATLAVHVLAVLSLHNYMDCAHVVALHSLAFSCVEGGKPKKLFHLLLFLCQGLSWSLFMLPWRSCQVDRGGSAMGAWWSWSGTCPWAGPPFPSLSFPVSVSVSTPWLSLPWMWSVTMEAVSFPTISLPLPITSHRQDLKGDGKTFSTRRCNLGNLDVLPVRLLLKHWRCSPAASWREVISWGLPQCYTIQ